MAAAQDKLCSSRKKSVYHSAGKIPHALKKGLCSSTLQCWRFKIPTALSISSIMFLVHGTILAKLSVLSKGSCTGRILVAQVTIGPNMDRWLHPDTSGAPKGIHRDEGRIAVLLHGQATLGQQSASPKQGTGVQIEPTGLEPPTKHSNDDTSRSASYH